MVRIITWNCIFYISYTVVSLCAKNFKAGGVFIMRNLFASLILLPICIAIPAFILYFVIKMAIKNAVKELKEENIL